MNRRAIYILWLIREYGPIDRPIPKWLKTNTTLSLLKSVKGFGPLQKEFPTLIKSPTTVDFFYEEELLIRAGLVERTSSLRVTNRLSTIQNIFDISLTDILKERSFTVKVSPLWGDPTEKNNQSASVFVAMPFHEELKPVYDDHILKITQELGLTCKRGDDFFSGNSIMNEVWSAIYHSEVCIVDCTGRNPNVFYELGIAHTLGRKAVLIAKSLDDIPFDVRHLRTIIYEYTPRGMVEFEERLKKTLQHELNL